jgi:hypothetical protein
MMVFHEKSLSCWWFVAQDDIFHVSGLFESIRDLNSSWIFVHVLSSVLTVFFSIRSFDFAQDDVVVERLISHEVAVFFVIRSQNN